MIDITLVIKPGMARFPDDPEIVFEQVQDVKSGERVNLKRYSFGSHTGTHVDAPYHILSDGKKTDAYPIDTFIGTATVFAFHGDINKQMLEGLSIKADDIILFKTSCSARNGENAYDPNHTSVLPSAARYLADIGVRVVGTDCLSIETDNELPVHHILLSADIPIIEGLDLSKVKPGEYRMTAMLMRIEDSDGAPLRAMLEAIE